jgi:hypothetical protein
VQPSLVDAVREGFLSKKSANGFVHRLAIFNTHGAGLVKVDPLA